MQAGSTSQANVLLHMFDSARIVVDLLLHLTLVFLEISQARLHMKILLLLSSKRSVVRIACKLKLWN